MPEVGGGATGAHVRKSRRGSGAPPTRSRRRECPRGARRASLGRGDGLGRGRGGRADPPRRAGRTRGQAARAVRDRAKPRREARAKKRGVIRESREAPGRPRGVRRRLRRRGRGPLAPAGGIGELPQPVPAGEPGRLRLLGDAVVGRAGPASSDQTSVPRHQTNGAREVLVVLQLPPEPLGCPIAPPRERASPGARPCRRRRG